MKPTETEYPAYYKYYLGLAEDDLMASLQNSANEIIELKSIISEEKSEFRYEKGKWSIKEVVQHIIDTERIMAYRALSFARDEKAELPGFDQDEYVGASNANNRKFEEIIDDFEIARKSTSSLFRSFDDEMLKKMGTANKTSVSVRAIGFMIAGHALHHLDVIRKYYL